MTTGAGAEEGSGGEAPLGQRGGARPRRLAVPTSRATPERIDLARPCSTSPPHSIGRPPGWCRWTTDSAPRPAHRASTWSSFRPDGRRLPGRLPAPLRRPVEHPERLPREPRPPRRGEVHAMKGRRSDGAGNQRISGGQSGSDPYFIAMPSTKRRNTPTPVRERRQPPNVASRGSAMVLAYGYATVTELGYRKALRNEALC